MVAIPYLKGLFIEKGSQSRKDPLCSYRIHRGDEKVRSKVMKDVPRSAPSSAQPPEPDTGPGLSMKATPLC